MTSSSVELHDPVVAEMERDPEENGWQTGVPVCESAEEDLPPMDPAAEQFASMVAAAYTITVIRFRTVTALEFFFNFYSLFKSFITTILSFPGMGQVISATGAGAIMDVPFLGDAIDLVENLLGLFLLMGSKPGYKIQLFDKDNNLTTELRGMVPKPPTLWKKLFPKGRHIRIHFQDASGNTVVTYDMPKKPCCGARKGAKILAGLVNGDKLDARIASKELRIVGEQSKTNCLDGCCQIRKIASKSPTMNFRHPFFFKHSGWPNRGQPTICPDVEIAPPGAGVKVAAVDTEALQKKASAAAGSQVTSAASKFAFKTSFWVKTPWPIIASTISTCNTVADQVGLGDVATAIEMGQVIKVSKAGSAVPPVASSQPAVTPDVDKPADQEESAFGKRLRHVLTVRARLHVDGELTRDFPAQQRLDLLTGMLWLDQTHFQVIIVG